MTNSGTTANSAAVLEVATGTPNSYGFLKLNENGSGASVLQLGAGPAVTQGISLIAPTTVTALLTTQAIVANGNVTVNSPAINIYAPAGSPTAFNLIRAPGQQAAFTSYSNSPTQQPRWQLQMAGGEAESGGNAGSNFNLVNFADNGAGLGTPLSISRATGIANFSQPPTVNGQGLATASNVGRNRLDNGGMQFWQRGLTYGPAGGTYLADRWFSSSSSPLFTVSRQQPSNWAALGWRSPDIYQQSVNMAVGDALYVIQKLEARSIAYLVGKTVTFSFDATAATTGAGFTFYIQFQTPGTKDDWSQSSNLFFSQILPAVNPSPGTYSVSVALPAAAVNGLEVAIALVQAGSSGTTTLQMTSCQLEAGAVATPFEHRSPAAELAACQRFYQVGSVGIYSYTAAGQRIGNVGILRSTMRATPTITFSNINYVNAANMAVVSSNAEFLSWSAGALSTGPAEAIANFAASADL